MVKVFQPIKLSFNSTENSYPEISGDNVVWSGFDGQDEEIYLYSNNTTVRLTENNIDDYSPKISGNNVVWSSFDEEDENIFLYSNNTIQQLNNTGDGYSPQISGNNVVWTGFNNADSEIYLYFNGIISQLTNNTSSDTIPQISGNNVVWRGFDGRDNEIYLYSNGVISQLTNNTRSDGNAQISGNNVVWTGFDGRDDEIYLYSNGVITQLTNNTISDATPQISGNNVVWTGFDGRDNEIFLYSNGVVTQITNNTTNDDFPKISENNVVWTGFDGRDTEIYLYSNGVVTQVTNNIISDEAPEISGNNIAWQQNDNNFLVSFTSDNLAPTNISLSNNTIRENLAINTTLGSFTTTDPDIIDTHTYSLVSGEGSADNAFFAISGNNLIARESFDFETKNSFSIRVRTDDGFGGLFENNFTISVSDINEAPTVLSLSNNTIQENQEPNSIIGSFTTIDPDVGNTHTYSLVSGEGSADNGLFAISGNNLIVRESFDFETRNSYSIRVITRDNRGLSREEIFNISVINVDFEGGNLIKGTVRGDNLTGTEINDLILGFQGNDTLRGGSNDDTLVGSSGIDSLDGGTEADRLIGGLGNDIYNVDNLNDLIEETSILATEIDRVNSSISFSLGSNLEALTLTGTAIIDGTGNTLNNIITGNNSSNILTGGGGNDSLNGSSGNDRLTGELGNDTLTGGNGNDTLIGGNGIDSLSGNLGNDTFALGSNSGTDTITDFQDNIDKFGLTNNLHFKNLTFVTVGTSTQIRQGNTILAIVSNIPITAITVEDFVTLV